MRKLSFFSVLCLCMFFNSCTKKESIQKEPNILVKPKTSIYKGSPVFMTGERDKFNPQSTVESVRKKTLTNLGRLKITPPVLTPDAATAADVLNKSDFSVLGVDLLENVPLAVSSYPFDYENDVEALKRLYNQHNLSAIVKDDQPELDTLMALMIYTNEFLAGGTPPAKNTWMTTTWPSAEIITKLRREKGIGGTSEHYAALFCQLSLSCGFDARLVSMHTLDDTGEPLTHDVCEVFLVSYDKWVVFDPYSRATYYLRDSIPQSALELRNLMFDGLYRDIYPVSGIGDFTDVVSVREKILPRYRYIYIWRMNDMLSKSQSGKPMPWHALYQVHLVWEDEKTLVADGGFEKLDKFNNTDNPEYPLNGVRYVTHNKSDFYWNLNRVVLNLERTGDYRLNMYIDTITPNFDYFEIYNAGDVYKYKKNIFELTNAFSEIYVRSFNKLGRCGVMSKLILMWD